FRSCSAEHRRRCDISRRNHQSPQREIRCGRARCSSRYTCLGHRWSGGSVGSRQDPSERRRIPRCLDPLHHGLVPLALLGQEPKNGTLVVGAEHAAPHQLATVGSAPGGIVIPPPGGPATKVFEAGLGARNGEPPGTHAGHPSFPVTTKTGTISFTRFHLCRSANHFEITWPYSVTPCVLCSDDARCFCRESSERGIRFSAHFRTR